MAAGGMTKKAAKSFGAIAVAVVILVLYRVADDGSASPASTNATKARETKRVASESRADNPKLRALFAKQKSDVFVTVTGRVKFRLPDDNEGSRHQRFVIDVGDGHTVLVAHNIDLAPRIPLRDGDSIRLRGEYEYTAKGGVLHFTHKPSRGSGNGGWVEHKGKRYE